MKHRLHHPVGSHSAVSNPAVSYVWSNILPEVFPERTKNHGYRRKLGKRDNLKILPSLQIKDKGLVLDPEITQESEMMITNLWNSLPSGSSSNMITFQDHAIQHGMSLLGFNDRFTALHKQRFFSLVSYNFVVLNDERWGESIVNPVALVALL